MGSSQGTVVARKDHETQDRQLLSSGAPIIPVYLESHDIARSGCYQGVEKKGTGTSRLSETCINRGVLLGASPFFKGLLWVFRLPPHDCRTVLIDRHINRLGKKRNMAVGEEELASPRVKAAEFAGEVWTAGVAGKTIPQIQRRQQRLKALAYEVWVHGIQRGTVNAR